MKCFACKKKQDSHFGIQRVAMYFAAYSSYIDRTLDFIHYLSRNMWFRLSLCLLLMMGNAARSIGQSQPAIKHLRSLHIRETSEAMSVDGVLDEASWQQADKSGAFNQRFPADTSLALSQTEVMLTYDKQYLYLAAICQDEIPGKFVTSTMKRDFESFGTDYFAIHIDPFSDQTNGFQFAVTPYGAQREGLITNGGNGRESVKISWDNKWFSKVKHYDGYWIVEMAIPFKTLRFQEGSTKWRVNFVRNDYKRPERNNWAWIPRVQRSWALAYAGELIWDKPLRKPGKNISLIPFATVGLSKNYEDEKAREMIRGIGGDIKIGVTPSLNLDLTVNPDFSQVEVDRQVTNLDRFEITFPERRQFFLENNDLFSDFGSRGLRPFFTRRIGIAKDTVTNETVANQILGGARLSGKLDKNWRIGLLNIQTAQDQNIQLPSTNYTVAVIQRQIFTRSNISGIYVNKLPFLSSFPGDSTKPTKGNYNQVAGLDYNYASPDNEWTGKFFYHQALDGIGSLSQNYGHGADLMFNNNNIEARWQHEAVGENYDAIVGFVRRNNYRRINPNFEYKWYPAIKGINRLSTEIKHDMLWTGDVGMTDYTTELNFSVRMSSAMFLRAAYEQNYVKLLGDFDPTRTGGEQLPEGSEYTFRRLAFLVFPNYSRPLTIFARGSIGEYYNGFRASISGSLNYRLPPFATVSIDYSVNRINLPDPYNDATLLLIGPRLDVTFRNDLFFTTLVQYNNQIKTFNVNARVQWRFKPASDLFLVYTDNYYFDPWVVRTRGIVLKLTYWLNV
ncbi:MAG: DUF5916 domain-containing protein [Bacteroidota bacterium]